MPKVMTIGSLKDALPAGSYQGQVGKLRSLGSTAKFMVASPSRTRRKSSQLHPEVRQAMREMAPKLTPAQREQMWRNIEAQIASEESGRTMRGLGYACREFTHVTRTRTVWRCPGGKSPSNYSRAEKQAKCKKIQKQTRELVCAEYSDKLMSPGITASHKRAGECKRPRRKLRQR